MNNFDRRTSQEFAEKDSHKQAEYKAVPKKILIQTTFQHAGAEKKFPSHHTMTACVNCQCNNLRLFEP
jgi:hypothetical protein